MFLFFFLRFFFVVSPLFLFFVVLLPLIRASDVLAIIFRMQEAIHPVSYFWPKVGNKPASFRVAEVA